MALIINNKLKNIISKCIIHFTTDYIYEYLDHKMNNTVPELYYEYFNTINLDKYCYDDEINLLKSDFLIKTKEEQIKIIENIYKEILYI